MYANKSYIAWVARQKKLEVILTLLLALLYPIKFTSLFFLIRDKVKTHKSEKTFCQLQVGHASFYFQSSLEKDRALISFHLNMGS